MRIPILVLAYNRHKSLRRLLNSLDNANYDRGDIDLIISIDKSDNGEVVNVAKSFNWEYGNKKIIEHDKNLGLRKHVLKAGDIVLNYDAIIMLEDDLVVSKSFYKYAMQSVDYYKNDPNIGGISLYHYKISEFANNRKFIPLQDESDIYFMNVPSSWGQIWTKNQWKEFRNWYDQQNYINKGYTETVPRIALNWPESSWKKYFYMYIAEYKKYIVYPRVALSTNMADIGTHHKSNSTAHQSVLMGSFDRDYVFKKLNDSICVYDAFFESVHLKEYLILNQDVIIDYYGIKDHFSDKPYILSTRKLNYKILNKWSLSLKPYELNIIYDLDGKDIYLYDMNKPVRNENGNNILRLIKYELPGIDKSKALRVAIYDYFSAIKKRIFKFKVLKQNTR